MATERQLRDKIRKLEEALAQQEQQSRRIQQQIANQTEEQIRQLQIQAQEMYQRRLNETTAAYAQRIRQFQETVLQQSSKQMEQLQKEANEIKQQTQETLKKMEAYTKELQDELQKIKDDANRQATTFEQAAQKALKQAENAQSLANNTPHSFFFPQEFDIISSHIRDIAGLIDMGMYQAAVSDAGCIELEFKLLQTKVNQAFSEWMQAFEDYRALVGVLYNQLKAFEGRELQTSAGTFHLKTRELEFWSCGAYSDIKGKVTAAYNTFYRMNQEQILDYLRKQAGTNRRAIYDLIAQGKKWEDQLIAVMNCIVSERLFSDQRFTVAQDVAKLIKELNGQTEVNQFCPPEAHKLTQKWYIAGEAEDPLNAFDLHMVIGAQNRIKLHSVPRREHGLAIGNLYFLSVDLTSAADPTTERLVAQENLEHINQVLREKNVNAAVQFIPFAEDPEKTIRKQEQLLSPPPSASAQMRYLERKYQ